MKYKLLNGALFNVSWLLIVASQSALVAWGVAALHVGLHMLIMGRGRAEWVFILLMSGFGLLVDQLLFIAGVLRLESGGTAPLWLSALWPVLATTSLHVFSGLRDNVPLAAVLGAAGGFLSYRLGVSLSDVAFGPMPASGITLALIWALLFPTLLFVASQLEQQVARPEPHAVC
ncbi:DUF2878 domain-containing protein [Seongchinamella unica]|uniref:DUF2878 domain-containing protein n=1 Tax=Seongchinamella unica TaxID=2547392 RepID=A0A4R5LNU3_9GAMM|nr:DUF2878 domain-containing protein [Seongchinamella unica]TDG11911.1 DUF2878 domain-containing protein [Seongchinamella unica]